MSKLKLPNFKEKQVKKLTRAEVRQMYYGLLGDDGKLSPKLDEIKNPSLMYAITRTQRKLKSVAEDMAPDAVIPDWKEYNDKVREKLEHLSAGKTIEAFDGSKQWDVNLSSAAYNNAMNAIKAEYGVDEYEEWIKGEFDEDISGFIHYANDKEVSVEKDVPNLGVYKLIHFLFKNKE